MKKKTIFITIGIIVIVLVGLFFIGKFYVNKLANEVNKLPTGEDAVKVMSPTEKDFLQNKFLRVEEGMTGTEIENILGPRFRIGVEDSLKVTGAKRRIDKWVCPEYSTIQDSNDWDCIIQVYFVDNKAVAIRWLRLNHFFYEIKWPGF